MKTLNITDRLKDNSKPTITIGETVIEVNNDAVSVLGIMELISGNASETDILEAAKLIFSKDDQKKLFDMGLSFENYMMVIGAAMELVTGTESVGE